MAASVTAALLVIGDEILTGRTKDKNIGYIAEYLTGIGIDLREVRVVPDVEEEIMAAVNVLRGRYTYVFTTGGIGPVSRGGGLAAGALPAAGTKRSPPAHGPHPGRSRSRRESYLQGSGLPPRQRLRHGRRAV